jgi:NAD(P)-dependent dehydrogenase (short-subunit alcohol dehydrogenase family)
LRGHTKITASHLSRRALIYVRQSTLAQVRNNTESTARQYGLTGLAARLGWAAVLLGGRSKARLDSAAERIGESVPGAVLTAKAVDVTDPASVAGFFGEGLPVDHVAVTADTTRTCTFLDQPLQDAQLSFGKFWGQYHVARHSAPHLRVGGSITFVSSVAASKPGRGMAVVAAVNGAVDALAAALTVELAPIRVNTVAPSWIVNPGTDAGQRRDLERWATRELPARRIGSPEDVAAAVLHLMQNPYINGVNLPVDGGLLRL